MATETALDLIQRQDWLDPLADALQQGVNNVFEQSGAAGRRAKNALHGVWMGHPVHSAVTDIPLGAWTAAAVCDLLDQATGRDEFGRGADVAVGVGLAGAALSALTGLTDWSATDGRARKIGLVHGLLNIAGSLLYTASLVARSKNRPAGRALAYAGYAIVFSSAYLGGELAYGEQVGVNHAAGGAPLPADFVDVMPDSGLGEGEMKRVLANGAPVLLARRQGQVCAIAAVCSHAGGPLEEGKLAGGAVTCPWHGSRFDVASGRVLDGPATHPQPCFEVRVREGRIEVRAGR